MTEKDAKSPAPPGGKNPQKARREEALAKALRDNLKRRKAQTRGRKEDKAP